MPAADRHQRSLTAGPIARTLVVFSLPILGSNALQSLNVSIDSVWIGHYLGEAALTASSNANLVLFFLLGAVFGVSIASTILMGQAMGAHDIDQAKRVFGTGLVFFLAISTFIAALGFMFTPEILTLMRTPPDAIPYAVSYLRVIFIALPAMYFYILLRMALRGAGDSHTPFMFMIVSVILDVVLNPVLIFGWGPIPAMGIAGSATATLIAQVVALVGLLAYLRHRRHFLFLKRHEWHYLIPDPAILRAMIVKGVPIGMQMTVVSSSGLILISLVNVYGSQVTAAYGAALQLWRYIRMPALAVGSAVGTMAAQNVGAGLWHRMGRITRAGVIYNALLTAALVAVTLIFSHALLGLFLPHDPVTLGIARHLNVIVLSSFVFVSISFVLFGIVRSTGAVIAPLVILVITLWGIRIPFAWIMRTWMGPNAVWWSFPLASLVTLVLAIFYYRFGHWRSARMLKPNPSTAAAEAPAVQADGPE